MYYLGDEGVYNKIFYFSKQRFFSDHLAIELAYRTKEEFHNLGKDSSNIMIYVRICAETSDNDIVDTPLVGEQFPKKWQSNHPRDLWIPRQLSKTYKGI